MTLKSLAFRYYVVGLTVVGCAQPASHLRTEVYPGAVTPQFLTEKTREVDHLEGRLADFEKLGRDPGRTYEGSHAALLKFVDEQKKKLAAAKTDLRTLKQQPAGTTTPDITARLNQGLDDLRANLNTAATQ